MDQVQQRVLALGLLLALGLDARKFYDDDPIRREPRPVRVESAKSRKLSEYYDFFLHTFGRPGERHPRGKPIPAGAVNTLGEVPDSGWYQNRHGSAPLTLEQLRRGPGAGHPPEMTGPWTVIAAKTEGVTPGFTIEDSAGTRYLLKVDPPGHPEMATGADAVGARFFHALGYWVPENYIVQFDRSKLTVDPKSVLVDALGKRRAMHERDIDEILFSVPRDEQKRYRAVASLYIEGTLLGPFRFYGVRRDDPNDVVPHEHRRDLRGLFVFSAWLGHNDVKSLNSLDSLVDEGDLRYIRHYLIDFGAALGSDSFTAKSPRAGNQYLFDLRPALIQTFTLGLYAPRWMRAHYPDLPSVGRFEAETFEPEAWKPNYPNPAFDNRLPDDTFWAAKQVMAFTDEQIRALVETGQYTDPRAVDWITSALIQRRDRIGRTYFDKVLPLDRFAASGGGLEFEDLAVKHNFTPARTYRIQWHSFDNEDERKTPLPAGNDFTIPPELQNAAEGAYFAADIHAGDARKTVTVYLRSRNGRIEVAGIDRSW